VRPEHIVIGRAGAVDAVVEGVEYLGADSLIACSIGGQPLTVRVGGRMAFVRGDAVRLGWAQGALHFFDAASGRRRHVAPNLEPVTMLA